MIAFLLLASPSMLPRAQAETVTRPGECQWGSLPSSIHAYLLQHYGTWGIQRPENLGSRARERWEAEKPIECPGIASGLFENNEQPSYALLLVPARRGDRGYRLLVFSSEDDKTSYAVRIVDHSEDADGSAFFIHTIRIGRFFDSKSRRKFQAQARQGILLIDAGQNEYEADVYYFTGLKYQMQWIDY